MGDVLHYEAMRVSIWKLIPTWSRKHAPIFGGAVAVVRRFRFVILLRFLRLNFHRIADNARTSATS